MASVGMLTLCILMGEPTLNAIMYGVLGGIGAFVMIAWLKLKFD